jgi:hypothetical protein
VAIGTVIAGIVMARKQKTRERDMQLAAADK